MAGGRRRLAARLTAVARVPGGMLCYRDRVDGMGWRTRQAEPDKPGEPADSQKMTMTTAPATTRTSLKSLQFQSFESLPCGCVAAVYRVPQVEVEVELVEARGPHCLDTEHQIGRVIRLGHPTEIDEIDEPEDEF